MQAGIATVVSALSVASVTTYIAGDALPSNQDFLFEPDQIELTNRLGASEDFYTHIINYNMSFIQVRNATDRPVYL